MSLESAVVDLRSVFADFRSAARAFLNAPPTTSLALFYSRHLPLLILIPVFSFLCPYRWVTSGHFSVRKHAIIPVFLAVAFIVLAVLFDRICEHTTPPEMNQPTRMRNLALFLHLPAAGSAPFFLVHPLLGYVMTLSAGCYSVILSVRAMSLTHNVTYARSFTRYLSAVILVFFPLVGFAAVLSVGRGLFTLERIFG